MEAAQRAVALLDKNPGSYTHTRCQQAALLAYAHCRVKLSTSSQLLTALARSPPLQPVHDRIAGVLATWDGDGVAIPFDIYNAGARLCISSARDAR